MKKMLLTGLFAICAIAARSQGRATTVKEYNYLVAGRYDANLAGHHLVKSSVYVIDQNVAASIWQLYRDGATTTSALVIIYYKNNVPLTYICIPDVKSPANMWADYNRRLGLLKNDGKALQVISYALGKFAATE